VLTPGEVADFDTRVPHWFGSTGNEPAEILSTFLRPGERMTVRTKTQPAKQQRAPQPSATSSLADPH